MVSCKMVQCYRVALFVLVAVLLFTEGCCFETRENIGRFRRQLKCGSEQFRCADGTCIDDVNLCDGTVDCPDGSDETEKACADFRCPAYLFQCAYGACVNADFRCNGVKNCRDSSDEVNCAVLPPSLTTTSAPNVPPSSAPPTKGGCLAPEYPENGKWSAYGGAQLAPGQEAPPLTILNYTCDAGYSLRPSNPLSFCSNGRWNESPQCTRVCPTLKSTERLGTWCDLDGGKVSCESPYEGTRARVQCRSLFEDPSVKRHPFRYCEDGSWNYPLPICEPVCGVKSADPQRLLIGGKNVTQGEYPWHVGIYLADDESYVCGGSIISTRIVLTAAHCFEKPDAGRFKVAAGKYYRKYRDDRDQFAQYTKVQEIVVHDEYNGGVPYVAFDLAVVVVQTAFRITPHVLPVCFDPDVDFDFSTLTNKKGIVTGWGFTSDIGGPAEVLNELEVDYKTKKTCSLPDGFKRHYVPYAPDKLCAGVLGEGKSACRGDSGGGLVFLDDKQERYYVRGLVSVGPNNGGSGCDDAQLTLYTSVQYHAELIHRYLSRYLTY